MEFTQTLVKATLLRRYKRFLADVRFDDGTEATVHCPNPGGMTGLMDPGSAVLLTDHEEEVRKKKEASPGPGRIRS